MTSGLNVSGSSVGTSSVRVLVVDDYEPWRRVISRTLEKQPELQIICEAADGLDAVQKGEELKPDLILLDIGLPRLDGIEAARRLHQLSPKSKILFVSQWSSADLVQEAFDVGAEGFVTKMDVGKKLLTAVNDVLRGNDSLSTLPKGAAPPLERFKYSITTKATPEVAWKVFSNWELWKQFSEFYDDIHWTKGEPWQEGSRLSIRAAKPIGITLDHVITVCVPAERVAWIDHALGTTMEQWVFFELRPGGGTRVHTLAEFTRMMPLIAGRRIKDVLLEFTQTWYDRYAMECDRVAGASSMLA
jgi:DNA-binding NarL/FixJ family response regulator